VTGSATSGGFCGVPQKPVPVYFVAEFDRPFRSFGTWQASTVHPGVASAVAQSTGPQPPATSGHGQSGDGSTGGWASFGDSPGQVGMKVAISYVSTANAWQNLTAEDSGWDLQAVAARTGRAWQSLLSKIQIGGGTHSQQVTFYSALYHALLAPTVDSDTNGEYAGFDRKVHSVAAGRTHYTNFSGWDIDRSEIPLLALLVPEQTSNMMQSLVEDAQQGGWLPKWPVASSYSGVMEGDPADEMIAEAYSFGARDFDVHAALAAMLKGATRVPDPKHLGQGWYEQRPQLSDYLRLGYVPNGPGAQSTTGASLTLEYATSDFAISRFAGALGQNTVAKQFLDRSQNWTHLYNADSGYLQPRDARGAFPSGNPVTTGLSGDTGQSGFREGTAAQYAFAVPQNLGGLIASMGGNAAVDRRLDQFFTESNAGPESSHYWAGNEQDLLAPWVYDYAGQPYRTATTVHQLLGSAYSDTPGGEPGNDDLGAMSSWYVLAALGLYPTTPETGVLAATTPLFPQAELQLPHGRTVITAPGVSDTNLHVQALTVNGHPSQRDWLPVSDLLGNASTTRLNFALTSQATPSWATGAEDEPPSYPA
jgi:predicted alpha-1,2-mannosidase